MPTERHVLRGIRWSGAGLVIAGLTGAYAVLLHLDASLLEWRNAAVHIQRHGALEQVLGSLRGFGETLACLLAIVLIAAFDRRRGAIITALIVGQLLAMSMYNTGKYAFERPRPYVAAQTHETSGAAPTETAQIHWNPGQRDEVRRSFPSGHSASAFVLAAILAWAYPQLGGMFWALALGCAASRFLEADHWPSDCAAGALIGYLAALAGRALAVRSSPLSTS